MPTNLNTSEVALRGVVEQGKLPTSGLISVEQRRAAEVQRYLEQNATPGGILEKMATELTPRAPLDPQLENNIQSRLGQEVKAHDGTNAKDKDPYKDLKAAAQADLAIQRQIIERGFDSLDETQKGLVIGRLVTAMKTSPDLMRVLAAKSEAEINQFAEKIANSKMYAEFLTTSYNDNGNTTNLDAKITVKPQDIEALAKKYSQADEKYRNEAATRNPEINRLQTNIDINQHRLEFTRLNENQLLNTQNKNTLRGNEIQSEIAHLNADIAGLPDGEDKNNKLLRVKELEDEAKINWDNGKLLQNYIDFKRGVGGTNPKIDEVKFKVDIDTDTKALNAQKAALEKTDKDRETARVNLEAKILQRFKQEAEVAQTITNASGEALNKWVNNAKTEYEQANQAYATTIEVTKGTPQDEFNKAVAGLYQDRRDEKLLGVINRRIERIDINGLNADYRDIMGGTITTVMDRLVPANLSPEERQKMVNDPDLQARLAEQVIRLRMKHGGGMSELDIDTILSHDWGKKAMDSAFEKNKYAREMRGQLERFGWNKGGFSEWLAKQDKKNLLSIVIAIFLGLGSIALTGVIPALGISASAIGAAGLGAASAAVGYAGTRK